MNITLLPLPRIVASDDIECPGDVIPFSCSIESNSEADLYLVQTLTIPSPNMPRLAYIYTSTISRTAGDFDFGNSTVNVVLPDDIALVNDTDIECRIEGFGNASTILKLQTSGK